MQFYTFHYSIFFLKCVFIVSNILQKNKILQKLLFNFTLLICTNLYAGSVYAELFFSLHSLDIVTFDELK